MQPAISNECNANIEREYGNHDNRKPTRHATFSIRRWFSEALDWLDRYWDDPELRSGFWRSGW